VAENREKAFMQSGDHPAAEVRKSGVRLRLSGWLALVALLLFVNAALNIYPEQRQLQVGVWVIWIALGALALTAAAVITPARPPLIVPTPAPLSEARPIWRVYVLLAGAVLLVLSEINGQMMGLASFGRVHSNMQFALLCLGVGLTLYGLGGAPRLRVRRLRLTRGDWLEVAAVIGVLLLALGVRVWDQENTVRQIIDELHWSDGVLFSLDSWAMWILYPMSAQSPYTQLFPYWQSGAVLLFGYSFTGLRFVSALCGVLTVLAAYGAGRALLDRRAALIGALVLACFPPHVHFSRIAMSLIADPLFGTMAVMFVARALRRNHRIEWAAAGVSLGFTQYFFEGGRILFPLLILVWLGVLTVCGHLRGRWRGVLILLMAFVLVAAPVYYTIVGHDLVLFGRWQDSGDSRGLEQTFDGGITLEGVLARVQRAVQPFLLYIAIPEATVYYGGEQPLVNLPIVPLFLFGAFYLALRFPAPAVIIPIWIISTAVGNSLLRDMFVAARYYVVLPALALAIGAGVRYGLLLIGQVTARISAAQSARVGGLAMAAVMLMLTSYHIVYYFSVHLPVFNLQARSAKPHRDGIDAVMRVEPLPENTQVILIDQPEQDQTVTRNWLRFVSRGWGSPTRLFPLIALLPDEVSPRYLRNLDRGVHYAFFIEPEASTAIAAIYAAFPGAYPPQYSTQPVPAQKAYVLIWVPVGSGS
jgi:4-amino-4-deoxy-L-arabinose transferase-like glycosyltransferase